MRLSSLHGLLAAVTISAAAACSQPNAPASPDLPAATDSVTRPDVADDIRPIVERVDQLLAAAWRRDGVTPAARVDDATFLRRASLDLIGVIPRLEAARAHLDGLDDGSKRASLLDGLVSSEAFARHWTNYWDDLLMEGGRNPVVDRPAFRQWLYLELRNGTAYDALVRKLLTAEGVNSEGGRPSPSEWEPSPDNPPAEGVNGAVNWLLRGAREPQNTAGAASRVFLGVQIQCAECHDHPTEKWKQDDFRRFTSAFMRVEGKRMEQGRGMGLRRVAVSDQSEPNRRMRRRMRVTGYGDLPATALDGTSLEGDSPRQALAAWMTAPENPWFARAIVNRMWGYFLGRGFVEPIDDFRADAEVAAPAVFDALVADFVAHRYDLRRLMRIISNTSAYQRAPAGAQTAPLWSAFALRPMNDTQLLDSLVVAARLAPVLEDVVGENLPRLKLRLRRQFGFIFDVDEDATGDSFTGTVPQALMLMNGPLVAAGSSALEGSTVGAAARVAGGHAATIEQLYLAALSRRPTPDELAHWTEYVDEAISADVRPSRGARRGPVARVVRHKRIDDLNARDLAYEDVFWALLNSSEFFFIH